MALSPEVKASIIIVAGRWAETSAKARIKINPKIKLGDDLKEQFGNAYVYLERLFKDDVPEAF